MSPRHSRMSVVVSSLLLLASSLGVFFLVASPVGAMQSARADNRADETGRELVLKFLELTFDTKDVAAAAELVREDYIQHNPYVKTGKDGFIEGITDWNNEHPNEKAEVKRLVAEGDLVVAHVRYHAPGAPDSAVVDIFRVQDGLIAEHWDVQQEVPPTSANENGMF